MQIVHEILGCLRSLLEMEHDLILTDYFKLLFMNLQNILQTMIFAT